MDESQGTRVYRCEYYTVKAHPRSCFFCEHLTDIFWDYTNGPYVFFCEQRHMDSPDDPNPIEQGMRGECEDFVEVEECAP